MSLQRFKVVIVGAGAAGIAAATRFLNKGQEDFIILEAENRIGGRIHSVELGGKTIELGAQWCHGEKDNIVYKLVENLNILESSVESGNFYLSNGTLLDKSVTDTLYKIAKEIDSAQENTFFENTSGARNFGEYFIKEYNKRIEEHFSDERDLKIAELFLETTHQCKLTFECAKTWFDISLDDKNYKTCEGNFHLQWGNHGYKTILDVLMKKTDKKLNFDNKILLNKEVNRIVWDTGNGVKIFCSDGSSYNCDQLILTVSLGVLQNFNLRFIPELPPLKQKCINGLELGNIQKIFLKFSKKWWPDDTTDFTFVWDESDKKELLREFPQGILSNGRSWLENVPGFYVIGSKHNISDVLLGWVVGDSIEEVENISDEVALEGCMLLLNKFLGKMFEISEPVGIRRTKWKSNPHFNGCWSFSSTREDLFNVSREDLAAPLVNSANQEVVLFAGEATHLLYYSTVHGAIESGYREADRVLEASKSAKLIHRKVAIIGAGIAGLAAATTLHKLGCNDLLLIEAQERPGGRIQSLTFAGNILELGAQWIHGKDNPVYQLARSSDLLSPVTSEEGLGVYLRDNGEVIDEGVVKIVEFQVGKILAECEKFVTTSDYPNSVGEYLQRRFMEYLNSEDDTQEIRDVKLELLRWHVVFQIIDNSCLSLDRLSAKHWGSYVCLDDEAHSNLKCEFGEIINILIDELPKNSLLLSTPVASINRATSTSETHKLICENGSVITCDYLIMTPSLGVLKNFKITPGLPQEVAQTIEEVGFGAIGKIFLIFEEKWWSEKGFQFVWRDTTTLEPEMSWVRYITGFDPIANGDNTLLGWVGGQGVKDMESLSDEDVNIHCMTLLRRFIRDRVIPKPIKVVRTTWLSNRWVRGSYSHITPNCDRSGSGMHKLSEPILVDGKPRILIAGEATHPCHYSTVHGAFESGQKQAQLLAEYLMKNSKL